MVDLHKPKIQQGGVEQITPKTEQEKIQEKIKIEEIKQKRIEDLEKEDINLLFLNIKNNLYKLKIPLIYENKTEKLSDDIINGELETLKNELDSDILFLNSIYAAKSELFEVGMKNKLEESKKELIEIEQKLNTLKASVLQNQKDNANLPRYNKLRNGTKEVTGKSRERAKENKGTIAKVGLGLGVGYLAYKGIKKVISRFSDDDDEKQEKTEKKGFWGKRYGKLVKRTGIGTAVYMVYSRIKDGLNPLEQIKNRRNNLWGNGPDQDPNNPDSNVKPTGNPDTIKEGAESLANKNPEIQLAYNTFGNEANNFYKNAGSELVGEDSFGGANYETINGQTYPGATFFALAGYGTFGDILSETTIIRQGTGVDVYEFIGTWKNLALNKLKKILLPFFQNIDNTLGNFINSAKSVDEIINKFKTDPTSLDKLKKAYSKIIKALSFLQEAENTYKEKLIREYLETNDQDFTNKTSDEQSELIEEKLNDSDFMEANIDNKVEEMRKMNLVEYENGSIGGVYKEFLDHKVFESVEVDEDLTKNIKKIEKESDDRQSDLEDIKEDLDDGKLDNIKAVKTWIDNLKEEMAQNGTDSRWRKLSFFSALFPSQANLKTSIYDNSPFKIKIETWIKQMNYILAKGESITLDDIENLSQIEKDYTEYMKQLEISSFEIKKTVDTHGNVIFRIGRRFNDNFIEGYDLLIDKKWVKGGLIVTGNTASVGVILYAIRHTFKTIGAIINTTYKVGMYTLGKGLDLTKYSLRGKITLAGKLYYSGGLKGLEEMSYDITRGKLSIPRTVKILEKKGIKNGLKYFTEKIFGTSGNKTKEVLDIFKKYGGNKNLMKELINGEYKNRRIVSPKDRLKLDKSKRQYNINTELLNEIHTLDGIHDGTTKGEIVEGFLKNAKKFDKIEEFSKFLDNITKAEIKSLGISPTKFGKLLGKYGKDILTKPEDIKDFIRFIENAKTNGAIKVERAFIKNTLKKRTKISEGVNKGEKIEDLAKSLKLNKGPIMKMRQIMSNSINRLKKLSTKTKLGKFLQTKYAKSAKTLETASENITANTLKTAKNMKGLDKLVGTGKYAFLENLSDNSLKGLRDLRNILKADKELIKNIAKVKTIEELKNLLKTKNIVLENNIIKYLFENKGGFLSKVGKNKGILKVIDFATEYKGLSAIAKVMKNPFSRKVFGLIGKSVPMIFGAFSAYGHYKEGEEIEKRNPKRAGLKYGQATSDLVIAGIETALLALGPETFGLSLLALGIVEGGRQIVGMYTEVVGEYYKNFEDFRKEHIGSIKNTFLAMLASGKDIEISGKEELQEIIGMCPGLLGEGEKEDYFKNNTKNDIIKSLIYLDNYEKYPLAFIDSTKLNEVQKEEQKTQKKDFFKQFNIQKEYIDAKFDGYLSEDILKGNNSMDKLDELMKDSKKYYEMKKEDPTKGIDDIDTFYTTKLEELKTQNSQLFTNLEKLEKTNPTKLWTIFKSLDNLQQLNNDNTDDPNQSTMNDSIQFVRSFYLLKYGNIPYYQQPNINVSLEETEFANIESFLLGNGEVVSKYGSEDEIKSAVLSGGLEFKNENDLIEEYEYSTNPGLNGLYDIAKIGGYKGYCKMDDLKEYYRDDDNEEQRGIYYDLNGNFVFDGYEFVTKYLIIPLVGVPLTEITNIKNYFFTNKLKISENDLGTVESLKKIKKFLKDTGIIINTKLGTYKNNLSLQTNNKIIAKIDEQINFVENKDKYKKEITDYIKNNSTNGEYILLPNDMIINGTRAGLPNLKMFVYKVENGKIIAYGAENLIKNNGGKNISEIAEEIKYIPGISVNDIVNGTNIDENLKENLKNAQKLYPEVEKAYSKANSLITADGGDLNLSNDIKNLINNTYKEYNFEKESPNQTESSIKQYKYKFDNIYTKILILASSGSSNDVNGDDFYDIKNNINEPYLGINFVWKQDQDNKETIKNNLSFLDGSYLEKVVEITNRTNKEKKLKGANSSEILFEIVKSVVEAGMLKFDSNGKIIEINGLGRRGVDDKLLEKRLKINIGG